MFYGQLFVFLLACLLVWFHERFTSLSYLFLVIPMFISPASLRLVQEVAPYYLEA